MDIPNTTPPAYSDLRSQNGAGAAEGSSAAPGSGSGRGISADFETFLRMLTVQMKNQDPLNPVDSSDYAVQLATFSSVEQQVLTNDLLRALGDQMGGGTLGQLAGWVGMEALARAPVAFVGAQIHLRPDYAETADTATLVVRNASDTIISRETIPVGEEAVVWAGLDDTGTRYPNGIYKFEIESYQNGTLIDTRQSQVYSGIQEARISDGTILLRLSGGTEIESSLVSGIRAPD